MNRTSLQLPLSLDATDTRLLDALSLKGCRFLTRQHLTLLGYQSIKRTYERIDELCSAGLVTRMKNPLARTEERKDIYTLSRKGARALAAIQKIKPYKLASAHKPSYLFLEHALRISDFMCSLESAFARRDMKISS